MITGVFISLVVAAAPASGVSGATVQPGATVAQPSVEPEIAAAESALKAAEMRAREAQIEVSRRVSEVQEARMGVDLARSEVDLRRLKSAAKSSGEKSRIKAIETRVSVLRSMIKEDLPAMRELQGRMLKAQADDPVTATGLQAELITRQRTIAGKQLELEIATLRASGGDPARIQAMERRLQDLKKQSPGRAPTGGPRGPDAGKKRKS